MEIRYEGENKVITDGSLTSKTDKDFDRFLKKQFVGTELENSEFRSLIHEFPNEDIEGYVSLMIMTPFDDVHVFHNTTFEDKSFSDEYKLKCLESFERTTDNTSNVFSKEDWIENGTLNTYIGIYYNFTQGAFNYLRDDETKHIYSILVEQSKNTKEAYLNLCKLDFNTILEEYNADRVEEAIDQEARKKQWEDFDKMFEYEDSNWEAAEIKELILKNDRILDCEVIKGELDGDVTAFIRYEFDGYNLYSTEFALNREMLFYYVERDVVYNIERFVKYTSSNIYSTMFFELQDRMKSRFEVAKFGKRVSALDLEETYKNADRPIDLFESFLVDSE